MDSELTNKKKKYYLLLQPSLQNTFGHLTLAEYEHRYIEKNICTNVKGKVSTDPLIQIEHRLG